MPYPKTRRYSSSYPKTPLTDEQRRAQEDRECIRNSLHRMSQGYNSRRREDSLNYEDDVAFAVARGAAAAQAAPPEVEEHMVVDGEDCGEEAMDAPAP